MRFPLIFQAFGDQKMPLQAYLLIPSLAIFGLNNFATRLPSALFGSFSIILIYFLCRNYKINVWASICASLFWAISPITFILSRFAYESNIALTFFLAGLVSLTKINMVNQKKNNPIYFFLWMTSWGLSWYAYVPYRFIIVVLTIIISVYWLWQKKNLILGLFGALLTLAIMIIPSFLATPIKSNLTRFNQIGILSDQGIVLNINQNRTFCEYNGNLPKFFCYGLWNKPIVMSSILSRHFVEAYSPSFLFIQGESEKYLNVDNTAQLNFLLLFPYFFGMMIIFQKKWKQILINGENDAILFFGLCLAPLPAILVGDPQKVRLSLYLPFLFLILAYGMDVIITYVLRKKIQTFYYQLSLFFILLIFSSIKYLVSYFAVHVEQYDWFYNNHAREISQYIDEQELTKEEVFMKVNYPDALMFYAYFTQLNPKIYQNKIVLGKLEESGFQHAIESGNLKIVDDDLMTLIKNFPDLKTGFYITTEYHHLNINLPESDLISLGAGYPFFQQLVFSLLVNNCLL